MPAGMELAKRALVCAGRASSRSGRGKVISRDGGAQPQIEGRSSTSILQSRNAVTIPFVFSIRSVRLRLATS